MEKAMTRGAPVGRFAPTPSGRMHLGNLSALLLAWLSARSKGGRFLLRIEDLDRERCRPEYGDRLLRDVELLGFDYDGEVVFQSRRDELYAHVLNELGKAARIYECYCTRAELRGAHASVDPDANAPHSGQAESVYSGRCKFLGAEERERLSAERRAALRIEVPDKLISFTDVRLGSFTENLAAQCGDFIIRRSDGGWAYQLAVVADDIAQGVTQVVRGRDLLGSTARQVWMYGLLNAEAPEYMHVPLLLAPDGKRLSKRERDMEIGPLLDVLSPEALIGRLAWLLGLQPFPVPASPQSLVRLFRRDRIVPEDVYVTEGLFYTNFS